MDPSFATKVIVTFLLRNSKLCRRCRWWIGCTGSEPVASVVLAQIRAFGIVIFFTGFMTKGIGILPVLATVTLVTLGGDLEKQGRC